MKIENLKVGQVLKNYKELCEVLGIKPTNKANNSRIAQFKELERYCKYHKEGHKIIIDEIYSKELEKVDNRKLGNNNEQAKFIRYLLLNQLSGYTLQKHEVIGFSKGLLLRKLNLLNDNYITAKVKREQYAIALEVNKISIDECIEYIDNRSINAVKRAISTLVSQKVLAYKWSYSWVDHKRIHHHADVFEHNAIMEAEFEVMEQMNIRHKGKIFEFGRWNEFKSRVKKYLLEEYSNLFPMLDYYYASFHFHYNIDQLQKHMRYMEQNQGVTYEVAREGVQNLWSKSLDKTIDNYNKNANEQVPFGICPNEKINYRKSESYKTEQMKVKNSIVNQDYPKIEISEQITMNLDQIDIPF